MGFFKDIKSTLGSATEAAKNAPAAKQAAEDRATEAQAGLVDGTQDPNDPGFEPVEGVTLDQYAKLCKSVAGAGLKDEAEVDQWAQQQGLQTGQFKRVSDEFTKRMGTNRALTNRFGMLYAQG
ncbi:MAG TPA: hypothetical protein VGR04_14565 [Acidimicrobiia bacterium]|nr:hypothetical protein [Acidimicrobiia bacterium]